MKQTKKVIFILVLIIIGGSLKLFSQKKKFEFEQLSIHEGLTQTSITSIHQDKIGFLWFGTLDGLNRYDGYNFTTYHHKPYDTNVLSSPLVTKVYEDRNGNLWVGTQNGGLNRIDRFTKKITRYMSNPGDMNSISSNSISSIIEDNQGDLWIGTTDNGLNKFELNNNRFIHFRPQKKSLNCLSSNNISSLIIDKNGVLWIGTLGGGLNKFENGKFFHYKHDLKNRNSLNSDFITCLYYDHDGYIWIGTNNNGINRFDPLTNQFLNNLNDKNFGKEIRNSIVNSILLDSEDILWVGTVTGLYYYDKSKNTSILNQNNLGDPKSLSYNNVLSIFEDRSGIIWVGTLNKLNKFIKNQNKFSQYHRLPDETNCLNDNMVRSIYKDKNGIIWIGTQYGGLNKLDRNKNRFYHFMSNPNDPSSLRSNYVSFIYEDKFENLWIATMGGGFGTFDRNTNKFHLSKYYEIYPQKLPNNVYYMLEDKSGNLWLGSTNGLYLIDNQKKEVRVYRNKWNDINSISFSNIYTIFEDRSGTIWVGTWNGLNKFDKNTEKFTRYMHNPLDNNSISNDLIVNIYEDESGYLWIATYGGGINKFDREKGTFRHYTVNEGLPNNSAYSTLPDNMGNFWISSNKGLSKFNIKTEKIKTYDLNDGLQELEFNGKVFYRSPDGEMLFGGINGFNCFYPEKIIDNDFIPEIVIVDFKRYGESINFDKCIPELKEIILSHTENNFTIEFVALSYFNPQKNKYAYILEGCDKSIQYCGTQRFVNYTNLESGVYIFKVFGSNGDDLWNKEGTSIKVTILPPIWRAWWAYLIYFLVLILVTFTFYKISMKRRKKKEEEKLIKEREKTKLLETELRIRNVELEAEAARAKALAAESQSILIKAENERNARELEEARKLQLSMLPKTIPDIPNLDIAVYMKTAAEVGGDYYDFLVDEDKSLMIALGDATGHGMKAGMMVSIIKSLFYSEVPKDNMERFYNECSNVIRKMSLGNLYMGLSLVKIEKNEMKICSAGMPPSYIYKAKKSLVEEIRFSSMPLGAVKEFSYEEKVLDIESGDTILLLTDGLPEQFNYKSEILGYDKITSAFNNSSKNQPQEIIDSLLKFSDEWSNGKPQNDDITMIVVKIK